MQASSDSEKSSTERKPVSFTSDTKSHDGKRAISTIKEQDISIDVVRDNSSKCSIKSCLIHHIQKSVTTITASAQRCAAFEKLAKRIRGDNEAQAERETAQRQASEILDLRQRQQAIIDRIDRIEQRSTEVVIRYSLQEMTDIHEQGSTVPANVQRQAQELQQRWINQQIQEMRQHVAENLVRLETSTNHLLQLATRKLERNLAKQQEILQQRLDEINDEINGVGQDEGNLADDEMGLPGSSDEDSLASTDDETTQVDIEIDRYDYHDWEVLRGSNLSPISDFPEPVFEESEETAVESGSEADRETPEAGESEEAGEDAEYLTESEQSEDEGYDAAVEMEEAPEDEGYCSMEE